MFKHNITYVDFNGIERTEDFYFHLSLPEVTRLEAKLGMDLGKYTEALVGRKDPKELVEFLEELMLSSYGVKTPDGRSFLKSKESRDAFEYSQAYADLFEQLFTDTELARRFGEQVADNGKNKKNQVAAKVVEE